MIRVSRPSLAASRRHTVLVLGSAGAGKTSAIQAALRAAGSTAADSVSSSAAAAVPPPPPPTLGAELYLKEEFFQGGRASLAIWDCSGAERYRPTLAQLYGGDNSAAASGGVSGASAARGAVLMYDMTDEHSFESLQFWYNEVLRCAPGAALLVVGTKSDQSDSLRISAEDGARQAAEWGATHLTLSAKTGLNVEGMFTLMLALIRKAQS